MFAKEPSVWCFVDSRGQFPYSQLFNESDKLIHLWAKDLIDTEEGGHFNAKQWVVWEITPEVHNWPTEATKSFFF